jgi:GTP-binding protein EngB required for normal cell division
LTTILGAEVVPDATALKRYSKAKQAVAREVRSLKRLLAECGSGQAADACQDLIVRLAEDRFTLAVVGQFKRGKSSVMNAVIGRDLLPTGVLPLTSAITVLRYGPQERLIIHRDGTQFAEETPVWRLAEYVTEKGNPGNQKKVRTACLELPLAFLRRGLEFVDTPGVGSTIEANTSTAYAFLPQCDAVLFVTSVDTPLTKTEIEFLGRIREHVRKVFFIVNKTDLLAGAEREEVLRFVAETLKTHMGGEPIRVLPLSCRLGLAAKMAGDADGYAASGLKALEETLAAFLSREKAATFLASVVDKALRLAAEGSDGTGRMQAAQERLARLRARVTDDTPPEVEPAAPPADTAPVPLPPEPTPAAIQEADLVQDLQTRGCPVCQRLGKAAVDFFARWQYALSSNEAAQTAFAAELGFCPLHAWQLFALSSPQGISQGYPKLVERLAREIASLAAALAAAPRLPRVPDSGNCRVCGLLRTVEKAHIQRLAGFVQTAEGRRAYAQSQGVCLRHLGLLVEAVGADGAVQFLLAEASRHFEEVAEDMQNFAMKREALRRTLHNRDEEDAYVRAIIHIVGESRVCVPWKQDAPV